MSALVRSPLKWAGGKGWLAPVLVKAINAVASAESMYLEPFFGGGSVGLNVSASRRVLSDLNPDLMEFWRWVKSDWEEVAAIAAGWENDRETFEMVRRSHSPAGSVRAARFLYLNRTCFGGLYRVNGRGEFNVPYGDNGRDVVPREALRLASIALASAEIVSGDYLASAELARVNDVIFADPPYGGFSSGGYDRYTQARFGYSAHVRLAQSLIRLADGGVHVFVSLPASADVLGMYPKEWSVYPSPRWTAISGQKAGRRHISEIVISSTRTHSISPSRPQVAGAARCDTA